MIVNLILRTISTIASWVLGLFPTWNLPDWMSGVAHTIQSLLANLAGWSLWLPLGAMSDVMLALVALVGVSLAVRVLRITLSLFTGGGGSAA